MTPSAFDRLTRRAALASGAALTGASVLGIRAQAAAQDATPVASPAAGSMLAHTDADFLFVQIASSATWTPKEGTDGVFTLTLTHQDGQTIYFSDRPARIVGVAPTQAFLDGLGFTPVDPPNAAIVAGEEVLVVELTNPVYDAAAGTLTYDATPIDPGDAADGIQHLATQQTDPELPQDLGPTSLFIDSAQATCSWYTNCFVSVPPGTNCADLSASAGAAMGKRQEEEEGTEDSEDCIPGPIPGGPIDACWDWNEFTCNPCDGSGKQALRDACNNAYSACNGNCDVYIGN